MFEYRFDNRSLEQFTLIFILTSFLQFSSFVSFYFGWHNFLPKFLISEEYVSGEYRFIALFFYLTAGLAGAALCALSKSWKTSPLSFKQVYQKFARYLLLVTIPLAAGTFILGERVIILLFGRDCLPSVTVIRVLALCLLPDLLNYIMSASLVSMNRQRVIVIAALVGAAAALLSIFILIPRWGAVGAAASLAVSISAVFFFQCYTLFRQFYGIATFVMGARVGVASGLIGLGLVWFTTIGMPLPLLVGLSVIVYSGALLLLGEVKFHEVKLGNELLSNFRNSLFVNGASHEKAQDKYRCKEEAI